jgi:hypothetical protein
LLSKIEQSETKKEFETETRVTRRYVFVYITLGHRGTIRRHALCIAGD